MGQFFMTLIKRVGLGSLQFNKNPLKDPERESCLVELLEKWCSAGWRVGWRKKEWTWRSQSWGCSGWCWGGWWQ